MLRIDKVTSEVSDCFECKKTFLQKTFRIDKNHYCLECATRQVFGKTTPLLRNYVSKFKNAVPYDKYIQLAKNILVNGLGSSMSRARKAIRVSQLDIRKLTKDRYVILSPAGKEYVDNVSPMNHGPESLYIDPKNPFESICEHVQAALNKGLPYSDAAEFIWGIRGEYDNITAMMYENHIIVTCPQTQRTLRLQL